MNKRSVFGVPGHVMMRRVGADAVIVDLEGGMYYGLNDVGAEIWKQLEAGAAVAEIEEAVLRDFEVALETVVADVARIVGELLERGLIVEVGPVEETGRSLS